jgi:tripeptide aminopeptidase
VRAELEAIGLAVTEDDTAAETGAACGNLVARIPGPPGARTVMFCAHIDTVPLADGVEVELVDGVYRNRRDAILGADDKAGVAVILEAARRWASGAPCGCELVFTTGEEVGLRGARAFDTGPLEAEFGFVLDHAAPIGRMVVAAPTYYAVHAEFLGRSAHAGLRPEDGRSAIGAAAKAVEAMRLGRIDEETTANVGVISGGVAANVVPERCTIEAEVRSLDDGKAAEAVHAMVDTITWAASATETDVDTTIEEHFRAYRIPESDPTVVTASAAMRDCGVEPVPTSTGGGSDASAFAAKGLPCLNLAIGVALNHTPQERVTAAALEKVLDITLRLAERAAEQ